MEKVCKDLKEHTITITNYEEKEIFTLKIEESKLYHEQNVFHIRKQRI